MSIIDWSSDVCSSDLQKEKTTLTGLYEARLIEANAVAGLLQTIEPGLRDRLRQASERFEATAKRNALSLRAAMELNNRLVQTIAEAVERHKPKPSGYTKTGATRAGGPTTDQAHPPVSLARHLYTGSPHVPPPPPPRPAESSEGRRYVEEGGRR